MKAIKKLARSLAFVSSLSLVTSPLALAEEAKNEQKEMLKATLKAVGLADNKNITLGESWQKIRQHFPPHMQHELDLAFQVMKDEKYPEMTFSESTNSKGEEVVTATITSGKDTGRLELLGRDDVLFKLNGKAVSSTDFYYITPAWEKLKNETLIKKDIARMEKAADAQPIVPTFSQWKMMSAYERAHFLATFRLMVEASQDVLAYHENRKSTKTSQLDRQIESFARMIAGDYADAADPKKEPYKLPYKSGTQTQTPPQRRIATGKPCIVGGYPSAVMKADGVCTLGDADKLKPEHTNGCQPSENVPQISCNPLLYGYNRTSGGPICVIYKRGEPDTQYATSIKCDLASPLKAGNAQDTMAFINSILKEKKSSSDVLGKFIVKKDSNGKEIVTVDESEYDTLLAGPNGILTEFNKQKEEAQKVCENIYANPSGFQKDYSDLVGHQTSACDRLLIRTADVQKALASIQPVTDIDKCTPPKSPVLPAILAEPPKSATCQCPATAPYPTPVPVPTKATESNPSAPCVNETTGGTVAAVTPENPKGELSCADGGDCLDGEGKTPEKPKKAEKKKRNWTPVIGMAILFGGMALLWNKRPKNRRSVNIPPLVVAPPGTTTPTPIVPPQPITNEGGNGNSPVTGGGVGGSPR